MASPKEGYVDGKHYTAYVEDVKLLKRSGQSTEAEDLLRRLVEATEAEARAMPCGVAPWYYDQLAILYRKQKRYDAEIEILQRFVQSPKARGVGATKLARRLKGALLAKEGDGTGPKKRPLRVKRAGTKEVTIDTDLGRVTIKNPNHHSTAIIASGQSAKHLRWYYDVYRKDVLTRAVDNLNRYLKGQKDRSDWSDSYFEFVQRAPSLLTNLVQEREAALQENHDRIERKEIQILGTYESRPEAEEVARWLSRELEPTLNAGWREVRVVPISQDLPVKD